MGLPKKALKESQLQFLTAGTAVSDSSHQTYKVSFIENGVIKNAFYKKLDPKNHYPELLAKISVAVSLFKRIFQGRRSAEERLVFDDEERLVGTLSISVDGFKGFNFHKESVPQEPSAKEQVIPSTRTLIEKSFMEILLGRWFLDDDDGHPHNLSLAGDIDFDMFFYWFTIYMKEPRPAIGIPKTRVNLTVRDWEGFPNVKDSKPFHWPTYKNPGQETLPTVLPVQDKLVNLILEKTYPDPGQFEQLAHEPVAQEQKFAAALKILLTYQPEMIRKRLTELFGEMTLNYTSLDETDVALRSQYEKTFPHLCNENTNIKPFVDFIMNLYQMHYDNLYRVVVFYMGCENNGYGVPLPATNSALYHKPSFYKDIVEWARTQNITIFSKDDSSIKFDEDELRRRYHQVWRDAYAPTFRDLLHDSYSLTNKLLQQVSTFHVVLDEVEGKKPTDDTLTNAWELFGTMPELSLEKITPLISVDKDSKLRTALILLVEFTTQFHAVAKTYYQKDRKDLTEEDNLEFSEQLVQLYTNYNLKIRQSLAHTSTLAGEFNRIAVGLKQYTERANFQLHLTTTDEQMKEATVATTPKEILPHTHEDVIRQFNDSLFLWAKNSRPEDLSHHISEIIDKYYAPTIELLSKRHRAQPVKEYLQASVNESGENRLAYILSAGEGDTGALNTLLIQHLTPYMLQTYPLLSIRNAVKEGGFDKDLEIFTKAAVDFAKHDRRFIHLYNVEGKSLFFKTMYEWIDELPATKFKGLLESALKDYEGKLWWSTSRRSEVEGYCTKFSQAKIVAMTFLNGKDSSSLNDVLFDKIIAAIQKDINKNKEKLKIPGFRLINCYNAKEHRADYFKEVKNYAEPVSHRQETTLNSNVTSLVV
ncbi:TPA: lpg2975 family Dot/Icm T4SS effector [Legionella pneumophila]|nr:lpg2975 family Dot/Icm T4SS effector [Legionella pneumophila]